MIYNLGQYISDGKTDIQCDTIRRFADGVYFVGQNENAGRCFGILNTCGDMWYFAHLTDDDVNTLTQYAEQNITQNHIDLLCDILARFDYRLRYVRLIPYEKVGIQRLRYDTPHEKT